MNSISLSLIGFVLFIMTSFSCSPIIKSSISRDLTKSLDPKEPIFVLLNENDLPPDSDYIGRIKTLDSGLSMTSCGYDKVIADAKKEAQKKGANIIALTKVKRPNLMTACYRIKANLYQNHNEKYLAQLNQKQQEEAQLLEPADYAVIHFYRPRYFPGSAISYDIKDQKGKVLGRAKNGSSFKYATTSFGKQVFYAKNEKEKIELDLQPGKEYFLKCSISAGFPTAKPDMYLMNKSLAAQELSSM